MQASAECLHEDIAPRSSASVPVDGEGVIIGFGAIRRHRYCYGMQAATLQLPLGARLGIWRCHKRDLFPSILVADIRIKPRNNPCVPIYI